MSNPPTTPDKAGRKAGTFVPGDPRINRKKAGPGRPPDAFKRFMQTLARLGEDGLRDVVEAGPTHPAFLGAMKHVTEHGYGKPPQSIDHTSAGKPIKGINVSLIRPEPGMEPNRLDAILAAGKNGSHANGNGSG